MIWENPVSIDKQDVGRHAVAHKFPGSGPTAEPILEVDDFGAPSPEDRRMERLLWDFVSFPEMKRLKLPEPTWKWHSAPELIWNP